MSSSNKGRPKSQRWALFQKVAPSNGMKTALARCVFCSSTVSATSKNMDTHYRNCTKVKRTVGALIEEDHVQPIAPQNDVPGVPPSVGSPSISINAASCTSNTSGPLSYMITNTMNETKKQNLNILFANAMNANATPFSFFDKKEWFDFFQAFNPSWKIPSPSDMGGKLLDTVYKDCMDKVSNEINRKGVGTLGIDGATNRLSKSVSNVIIHLSLPFFIEYLTADMRRVPAENISTKVKDVITRLNRTCGKSFVGHSFRILAM